MFRKLFSPDNPLMIFMSHVTDCIFLSLFFLLGSLPVLTVGTSAAAMYDAIFRGCRKKDKHSWQRFLHVYRANWKEGVLPTIVVLLLLGALAFGMIQLWNGAVYGTVSWLVFAGAAFLAVLVVGILSVVFPMLSRFESSFAALMKNTVFLSLANLPRTVGLGIVNTATIILCVYYVIPVFFLPAMAALAGSFLLEPMFKPYMPEEDAD